ncbi:MAG: MBL fold metallo-hydrolase [Candidatus Sulfomarinibacteraceae bacterium]
MKLKSIVAIVGLAIVSTLTSVAKAADPPPRVEASHLTGHLHRFRCLEYVSVIASVGEDGTLLVDTGYGASAEGLREELAEMGAPPIRIVINTHGDLDHVGGNDLLADGAVVISNPDVRRRMRTYFALPVMDVPGQPSVTLGGETTVHFNGETIRLIPLTGGHSAGDLVVHFTDSRIACVGDIVLAGTFPNADPGRGGDARRLAGVLNELVRRLPADTTIVSAHGDAMTMEELGVYTEMVEGTMAAVAAEIEAGRSLAEIVELNPLSPWAEWESPEVGLTFERWIREIHASLTGTSTQSICAPVTEALERDGIDAAVARYRELRRDEPESWQFERWQLNILGYQLMARERYDDAIAILTLNVEAFPDHFDPYDSLGEAYMRAGRDEPAVANYERSLELNPDNANAVEMLARIRGER